MPLKMWLYAAIAVGVSLMVWYYQERSEVQSMRSELMAKQRAVVAELGPRWDPLRTKLEKWTAECAAADEGEEVLDKDTLAKWDFRSRPGLYMRMARKTARGKTTLRDAAKKSLHDGFTSCLLVANNPSPVAGPACETTRDCPARQLCNEFKHCAPHSQPYNLRVAYKTMHVMSDEWVKDVQDVTDKLVIRGTIATFEDLNKYDIPVAVDLLARAEYYLLVLDEAPAKGAKAVVELEPDADAGVHTDDRSIATAPHKARVCVWRLRDDRRVMSLRRDAAGQLMGASGSNLPPQTQIARQRQANSCSLALAVREELGPPPGSQRRPKKDAPGPTASASAAPDDAAPNASASAAPSASPSAAASATPAASSAPAASAPKP